jgi:hypothetical protein
MHEDAPNQFNDDRSLSTTLLVDLRQIIDRCKAQVVVAVNSTLTLTYWHVGQRINADVLQGARAEYGKQVVTSLAR